jgi:hypothetical protein
LKIAPPKDLAANISCSPGLWPGVVSIGAGSVLMESDPGAEPGAAFIKRHVPRLAISPGRERALSNVIVPTAGRRRRVAAGAALAVVVSKLRMSPFDGRRGAGPHLWSFPEDAILAELVHDPHLLQHAKERIANAGEA